MDQTPIIQIENVNVYYDKGKPGETHALTDINLEIYRGEYIAFFGPSGSGKTTLLYVISGMDKPQEGSVLVNGKDITKYSSIELAMFRQIGVGIIFQQFNLIASLTVLDNVALPMAFLGIETNRRREEALRILDRLAMKEFANRYPHELSGGQQQRVGIARALANNAPIIIADEPLGNLDSENAEKVLVFLRELHEKDRRTIIMVTHEAWSLRDVGRVFHLKDGIVTRIEVIDQKNRAKDPRTISTAYEALPLPTPEEMSGVLAGFLMRGYSKEEVSRLKFFVTRRMQNTISAIEFMGALDEPFKDGGVGLWKQKARRIALFVEGVISEKRLFHDIKERLSQYPESPLLEEIQMMRRWIMEGYKGNISGLQQLQLDELIEERIRHIITPEHFKKILNLAPRKFGIGLRLRIAQELSDKLEMILKTG